MSIANKGSDQPKAKQGGVGKGRTAKKAEFSKKVLAEPKPWEHFDHIVMNLPASALEFLGEKSVLVSVCPVLLRFF